MKLAETVRENHHAWRKWWETGCAGFIPMLWRWFRDGDYDHPPSAIALETKLTKPGNESRRKELIDRA
jgi:hypothetical protein